MSGPDSLVWHRSLFSLMEKAVAICFARPGGITARGASFRSTTAKSLTGEPGVKGRGATRNRFGQAVTAAFGRRMVQGPRQQMVQMRFIPLTAVAIHRRSGWSYGLSRRIRMVGDLIGQANPGCENQRPNSQYAAYSHDHSPFLPRLKAGPSRE